MLYSTILADPPWQQKAGRPLSGGYKLNGDRQIFNPAGNKSEELPYSTMSMEEICSLSVPAAKDAHLYLWVTNKYLMQAEKVINSWGFKYSTTLVWAKNAMGGGLGGSYRITTEFLLFCTRGNLKRRASHTGTWFNYKRPYKNGYPCHSKKPPEFHSLIESVSPGPYLEMFAREQRYGWDVWGNEIQSTITL